MSNSRFALDVSEWSEKAKAKALTVVKETLQTINNEIIKNTPVDTGYLRGSWFANLNSLPSGTGTISRNSSVAVNALLTRLKIGDVYYMGNTAAYAMRVEFGFVGTDSLGRVYNQRGRFFMRGVLARSSAIAAAAAVRVSARSR